MIEGAGAICGGGRMSEEDLTRRDKSCFASVIHNGLVAFADWVQGCRLGTGLHTENTST